MRIKCLGYVGVLAKDLDAWRSFASELLGMQVDETPAGLGLRMDDKPHRILVHPSADDAAAYFGWEVEDAAELDAAAAHLEVNGVRVHPSTDAELEIRRVRGLVWCADPLGNRVELYYGLA